MQMFEKGKMCIGVFRLVRTAFCWVSVRQSLTWQLVQSPYDSVEQTVGLSRNRPEGCAPLLATSWPRICIQHCIDQITS